MDEQLEAAEIELLQGRPLLQGVVQPDAGEEQKHIHAHAAHQDDAVIEQGLGEQRVIRNGGELSGVHTHDPQDGEAK